MDLVLVLAARLQKLRDFSASPQNDTLGMQDENSRSADALGDTTDRNEAP